MAPIWHQRGTYLAPSLARVGVPDTYACHLSVREVVDVHESLMPQAEGPWRSGPAGRADERGVPQKFSFPSR